tara:strand:- start:620 stop:3748 length:3129 start_codon:yes stop_codon:yes gene_type:complete
MSLIDRYALDSNFVSQFGVQPITGSLGGSYVSGKINNGFSINRSGGEFSIRPSDFGIDLNSNVWGFTGWALANTNSLDTNANRHNLMNIGTYYDANEIDIRLGFHSSTLGQRSMSVGIYQNQSGKSVPGGRTYTTAQYQDWILYGMFCDGTSLHLWTWEKDNGAQYSSSAISWDSSTYSFEDKVIFGGYDWDKDSWNGGIDEFRIYDGPISKKEFSELAKAKVLHYTFNDFQEPTSNLLGVLGSDAEIERSGTSYPYYSVNITSQVLANWSTTNNEITYSYEGKRDSGGGYPAGYIYFTDWSWSSSGGPQTDNWTPYSKTATMPNPAGKTVYFAVYHMSSGSAGRSYSRKHQVEFKDHSTPFTKISRTGTVTDVSGFGNDAPMNDLYSPQWVDESVIGSGSYNFDLERILYPTAFNVIDKLTLACWVKPDSARESGFIQGGGGFYLSCGGDMKLRAYWYGTSSAGYHTSPTVTIPVNEWTHVSATWTGSQCILYQNGVEIHRANTNTPGTASAYIAFGTEGNNWPPTSSRNLNGSLGDVRIYASALSSDDVLELYNTRAQLDDTGNLFINEVETNGFKRTELDYSKWVIGSSGSQTDFSANGTTAENRIITRDNPNGDNDVIWETPVSDTTSNADGGWNTSTFSIDRTKKYRTSVWIRRENVGNGRTYFGCQGSQVWNIGTTTVNTNPYFTSWLTSQIPAAVDGWVLMVAYIHPTDYTGGSDPTNGIYTSDGTRVGGVADFRWTSTATSSQQRVYLYYSTSVGERQYYYRPRFEEMNGTEPSLDYLINCAEHRPLININNEFVFDKKSITNSGIGEFNEISEVGVTDGLVGYWPLNGNAEDYSGNGNNGTVTGAVVSSGLKDLAYDFNYTTDKIDIGAIGNLSNNFTISCIFNSNNIANSQNMISRNGPYFLGIRSSKIWGGVYAGGSWSWPTGGAALASSTWYHACLTYDGVNAKIYINGVLQNSTAQSGTVISNGALRLGYTTGGADAPMDGKIASVKIFSRALTPEEIFIEYKYGLTNTGMQIEQNATLFLNNEINEGL